MIITPREYSTVRLGVESESIESKHRIVDYWGSPLIIIYVLSPPGLSIDPTVASQGMQITDHCAFALHSLTEKNNEWI